MTFATLRLGKTSVEDIRLIDAQESGILTSPMTISVVCTQVPADLLPGTYTFLWLGSDNSKGMSSLIASSIVFLFQAGPLDDSGAQD